MLAKPAVSNQAELETCLMWTNQACLSRLMNGDDWINVDDWINGVDYYLILGLNHWRSDEF